MGLFSKKSPAEKLFNADKAVRNFAKGKKKLSSSEHRTMSKLLKKRASAMSEACGVKISSISGKDFQKFLKNKK